MAGPREHTRAESSYGAPAVRQLFHSAGHDRLFYPEFDSPATNNGMAQSADADQYYEHGLSNFRTARRLLHRHAHRFDEYAIPHLDGNVIASRLDLRHLHHNLIGGLLDNHGFVVGLIVGKKHSADGVLRQIRARKLSRYRLLCLSPDRRRSPSANLVRKALVTRAESASISSNKVRKFPTRSPKGASIKI